MKNFNLICLICLICLLALAGKSWASSGKSGAPGSKPNILFIFADDLSYETVGFSGMTDIDTPNLDQLAASGTRFTHAYNSGGWAGAICMASRAMLNTGKQLWTARKLARGPGIRRLAGAKKMWSSRMKARGYETYFTGKWHVGVNTKQIFDHVSHVRGGMPKQVAAGYNRPVQGKKDVWSPYNKKFGGFWKGGTHWSEVVADDALRFIKHAKVVREKKDKPFFMYLAFNAAHDPRQAPKAFVDQYPLSRIKVPDNFLPLYPFKDKIGCGPGLRDEKLAPFPRTKHSIKVHRQEYYALISHMDQQIGRILKALKQSGLAENTIIVFTSDHGLAVGRHGLLGKQNMYDHSMRVPFCIVGPGVPKGKLIGSPIYYQDVMATSLVLAGDKEIENLDFHDLMPKIKAKTTQQQGIYGAYLVGAQRMYIAEGFKLIIYPKAKVYRLYDLRNDPKEMKSLAGDPRFTAKAHSLWIQFQAEQKKMKDPLRIDFAAFRGK